MSHVDFRPPIVRWWFVALLAAVLGGVLFLQYEDSVCHDVDNPCVLRVLRGSR